LVDDNPADIDLTREVLGKCKWHFHVNAVNDGAEAISLLRHKGKYSQAATPDLIILDLNLPCQDGRQVLAEVKSDTELAKIPVVIFTTSQASSDISRCYQLGANCYLRKPGNLADFVAIVQSMADFWLGFASLPHKEKR
jgi:two-component system, chemotaxis family, response regulator Rcp1